MEAAVVTINESIASASDGGCYFLFEFCAGFLILQFLSMKEIVILATACHYQKSVIINFRKSLLPEAQRFHVDHLHSLLRALLFER